MARPSTVGYLSTHRVARRLLESIYEHKGSTLEELELRTKIPTVHLRSTVRELAGYGLVEVWPSPGSSRDADRSGAVIGPSERASSFLRLMGEVDEVRTKYPNLFGAMFLHERARISLRASEDRDRL